MRHRHMAGIDGGPRDGDIGLVRNLPVYGRFVRVGTLRGRDPRGRRGFRTDPRGHAPDRAERRREWPGGRLGCRAPPLHTRNLDGPGADIDVTLAAREGAFPGSAPRTRVRQIVDEGMMTPGTALADRLNHQFQGAEREAVIAEAPRGLCAEVIATGGPAERGADLEIRQGHPLVEGMDFGTMVQAQDRSGGTKRHPIGEVRWAIETHGDGRSARMVAAILTLGAAGPDETLDEAKRRFAAETGVPIGILARHARGDPIVRGSIWHRSGPIRMGRRGPSRSGGAGVPRAI